MDNDRDLLDLVTQAHGGLEPWHEARGLRAEVTLTGDFFDWKKQPGLFGKTVVTIDPHRQWVRIAGQESGRIIEFDAEADLVRVTTVDGEVVEELSHPRQSLLGGTPLTAWSAAQIGYFISYGLWNYLTEPYLFHRDGVRHRELEPWTENGETWRRLEVTFPEGHAAHQRTIVYHFDARTGLQRRMDYAPEVTGGDSPAAHYQYAHRWFDGVLVPTQRRVRPGGPAGQATPDYAFILVDIASVRLTAEPPRPDGAA